MTYPFGIDVSKWQGAMDWQKAKDAGVQFAFVKATEGDGWVDPTFAYNWAELERLNIPHGAYHFFRPKQSVTQVEQFVGIAGKDALLVFDLEDTGGLDRNAMTVKTLRALELIKQLTGKYPIVYSRYSWLNSNVIMSMLPKLDYWLAQYRWAYPYPLYTPEYPSELIAAPAGIERQRIKFHQSGERGNGSKFGAQARYIDTDRFIGTDAELVSYFGGASETQPEPEPEVALYEAKVTVGAGSYLNVRDSANGKIVGKLYKGDVVQVYAESAGWARIGLGRWVSASWIERVTNLPPTPPPSGTLAVEPMSQNDPAWKNNQLGTSSTTIGWNGCLITCVAMVQKFYGIDTDPARLNTWLTANGGYANGNLLYWGKIPFPISTWVDCMDVPAPLSQIDAALGRGEPVIVHVDFYPSTNPIDEHYVLLIGKLADDDYVMIDSWDGFVGSFKSRYKDVRRFVYRIVSYRRQA